MILKIIPIGNSVGVIIPKKELEEKGLKTNDKVAVSITPLFTADKQIHDMTQKLIKQYQSALEELAEE